MSKKGSPSFKDAKMIKIPKKISLLIGCLILSLVFSSFTFSKKKDKNKDKDQKATQQTSSLVLVKPIKPIVVPVKPVEDIEKIQTELKQIIVRTQQLQTQVRDDRSEIQQILERAQIHQRILKGITIPQPIQSKQQINQNDMIAREKMRLIAQQVHQTQEQLKAIQNSKMVNSTPKTESSQTS